MSEIHDEVKFPVENKHYNMIHIDVDQAVFWITIVSSAVKIIFFFLLLFIVVINDNKKLLLVFNILISV